MLINRTQVEQRYRDKVVPLVKLIMMLLVLLLDQKELRETLLQELHLKV